jgi:enamine deaminase RidA (YjgF/YER057c/UK114 family)
MTETVEQRLAKHGYQIPAAPEAIGFYVPVTRIGNMVVTSGQLPMVGKELTFKGKVGREVHEDDAAHAARICALNALAQIKACLGSLDRVIRIVRVEGYVQSADGFTKQPQVINGASELLVQAFGESGKHTRIAVGANELPLNAAVELVIWAETA